MRSNTPMPPAVLPSVGPMNFSFLGYSKNLFVERCVDTEYETREHVSFVYHGTVDHQIVLFNCLDGCHESPDSGERQHKPRAWKRCFGGHK